MRRTLVSGVISLTAVIAGFVGPGVANASASSTTTAGVSPAQPLVNSYLIKNVHTGLCVDVPGYDAPAVDGPVTQWHCSPGSGDNQQFIFWRQGTSNGYDVVLLENTKGLCVDLPGYGSVPSATKVFTYNCRSSDDNQLWRLEPRYLDGGFYGYWVRNLASGLCLDVPGIGTGGPDVQLEVYPCSSDIEDDHHWRAV